MHKKWVVGERVVCLQSGRVLTKGQFYKITRIEVDRHYVNWLILDNMDYRMFHEELFNPVFKSMNILYAICENPPKKRIRGRNKLDYRVNPLPSWDRTDNMEIDPPAYFVDGRWKRGSIL